MLSRVLEGLVHTAKNEGVIPNVPMFSYVSVIVWGFVMYLFERDNTALNRSLDSSMQFIYRDSDKVDGWRDFVPFYIPK